MSTPISACWVYRAALGDQKAFERLVEDMEYNLRQAAFSTYPCECKPPCAVPTDQQLEDLNKRVMEGVVALRKKLFGNRKPDRKSPRGFNKFIAPVIKTMPDTKASDLLP